MTPELSVIGAILFDGSSVGEVSHILAPEDFADHDLGVIYSTACSLFANGKQISAVTIADAAHVNTELMEKAMSSVWSSAQILAHAEIVVEDARKREACSQAHTATHMVSEGKTSAEVINAVTASLDALRLKGETGGLLPMSDLVPDVYRDVTEAHAEGGIIPGIKTHIAPLDSKLMGLVKQDLVILAARPSIGKTALAVQIALNVCDSGHVVAYFGLEGTAISIIHRMLASRAGVPMDQIRTGMFENAKTPQLATAAEYLEKVGAKFYMDFRSVLTPSLIRAEIRRLKRSDGIGLVIVDHIGLMRSGEKTNSRNEEIGAVSRSLKGCAKDFDVPVIALSQLNRDGDGRRPELKSLRDSGSLEQDADLVMLMYRETNDDGEKVPATEVNIAKARNGPTGIVNLFFNERIIKFEEMGMR